MIHQSIFDIAELLHLKGVEHVVLSPGSRNAPLTVSFARHPKIKVYSILDERSAGFIALGIAQKSKTPVVICCTSGTALLNYAPAVAEAYYQQIPLIVLSADRPPEWIDQRDGQTINQRHALTNFVKSYYQLPVVLEHPDERWEVNRKLNEAVNHSVRVPAGPVHINIPFREPFYPDDQELAYTKDIRIIEQARNDSSIIPDELIKKWNHYNKRLIIIGQHPQDETLKELLVNFSREAAIPIITDIISNQFSDQFIQHQDLFLSQPNNDVIASLQPELVISTGKSVISKSLKAFLRKHPPKEHWHFEPGQNHADTFQSLTHIIAGNLKDFLNQLKVHPDQEFDQQIQANFLQYWTSQNEITRRKLHQELDKAQFSEFPATQLILKKIPGGTDLHLANSMPVRYANLLHGINASVNIYANRGTSGIDGTNGTAVGNSLVTHEPVVLLSGDLSLFYDRNAFFHQHDISNLKIIVINNQGGGIFRLIKGPSTLPELEPYFETRHHHSAKFMAAEFGFDYYAAKDEKSLNKGLIALFKDNKEKKLLEVFTNPNQNQEVYTQIKNSIHE